MYIDHFVMNIVPLYFMHYYLWDHLPLLIVIAVDVLGKQFWEAVPIQTWVALCLISLLHVIYAHLETKVQPQPQPQPPKVVVTTEEEKVVNVDSF
jgi:hypothetical protein